MITRNIMFTTEETLKPYCCHSFYIYIYIYIYILYTFTMHTYVYNSIVSDWEILLRPNLLAWFVIYISTRQNLANQIFVFENYDLMIWIIMFILLFGIVRQHNLNLCVGMWKGDRKRYVFHMWDWEWKREREREDK